MRKKPDGQPELVLENKQLLAIFFVIVALCGVFFSLGYIVGRNTFSSVVRVTQAASGTGDSVSKPSPMPPAAYANQPGQAAVPADGAPEQPTPAADLNFYQSVEEKAPDGKLVPSEPANAAAAAARPVPEGSRQPSTEKIPTASTQPPPAATVAAFMVQVSALTRREDANTLVALLKGKKLPVLVTSAANDTLFHVMVGPYENQKDAEHAKELLEKDGFRPIIKR